MVSGTFCVAWILEAIGIAVEVFQGHVHSQYWGMIELRTRVAVAEAATSEILSGKLGRKCK